MRWAVKSERKSAPKHMVLKLLPFMSNPQLRGGCQAATRAELICSRSLMWILSCVPSHNISGFKKFNPCCPIPHRPSPLQHSSSKREILRLSVIEWLTSL